MSRILAASICALFVSAVLPAATINTTLTVTNATGSLSGTSVTIAGPATLTNIGSGTFSTTVSLTAVTGANVTVPFTITLTGGAGTITGNLTFPATLVSGSVSSGSGSATITGGTYGGGVTGGSFTNLNGTSSGSLLTNNLSLGFSGSGTINTGGSGGGPTAPTVAITDVLDAGSYTHTLAQGSIFVVKGTGLSASGYTAMSFPLPTASSGVSITFTPTSGGQSTQAYLIYLYNQSGVNQLAAVLPSTVAPGSYNVTVTNGSTSSPFQVTVVPRKLGLITQDSTGTGLAVVQNFISQTQLDIDRFTTGSISGITISPATPGQTLIAWGTGMGGGVPGGDNNAQQAYDFTQNGVTVQVLVGGVAITPLYAGSAPGLAGADQIDFTLPANVPTGCTVPFQISVNGQLSNPTFISIAPSAGATACVASGLTTAQLQQLDQGGTIVSGGFSLDQLTVSAAGLAISEGIAGGGFTKYTGFQLAGLISSLAQVSVSTSGACTVYQTTTSNGATVSGGGVGLDAGAVTLTGPSGSNLNAQALKQDAGTKQYSLLLGSGIPGAVSANIVAGTYTLNGAGGADVGKFSTSLALGSPLTITGGLPTTVNRSAGLPLAWTGGNSTDLVQITGSSSTTTGSGTSAVTNATTFVCTTTAGAGGFTVPSSILQQLPAVSSAGGFLEVVSGPTPASFTAPLTAGGNVNSTFGAFAGTGGQAAYQ